jgi:hypothetical protein
MMAARCSVHSALGPDQHFFLLFVFYFCWPRELNCEGNLLTIHEIIQKNVDSKKRVIPFWNQMLVLFCLKLSIVVFPKKVMTSCKCDASLLVTGVVMASPQRNMLLIYKFFQQQQKIQV